MEITTEEAMAVTTQGAMGVTTTKYMITTDTEEDTFLDYKHIKDCCSCQQ